VPALVTQVASGITLLDVEYLGRREVIAACLLDSPAGPLLVDPGPAVSLPALRQRLAEAGVALPELTAVLLTHIHLDHAGGVGSLVREHPTLQVYVHERGARHLVDPSRLLESARRVYGSEMAWRWGEFLAVPRPNVHALSGGEALSVGGRQLRVEWTPGHASHHVSFLDSDTGTALVGDTGGNRYSNRPFVSPVTPPPDVDLEAWHTSLDRIASWAPDRLVSTHFGVSWPVPPHLDELRGRLEAWSRRVLDTLDEPGTDEAKAEAFAAWAGSEVRRHMDEADARAYEWGTTALNSWHGLARYWRGRREASAD
jgi:glyoxylase-like metal-dependent hydrolase (beta-lactamase superfamily II)